MSLMGRSMTWAEFCEWLQGRRVIGVVEEESETRLTFDDGSVAMLASTKSDPTPGYSEYTPGSDGHLTLPMVRVLDGRSGR